mmetsp:Transcript_123/g.244  ORF Transcript_123/g.244 Transcript_123/m.244 type:complete len:201 (+) Transcript_123:733-1335(+)
MKDRNPMQRAWQAEDASLLPSMVLHTASLSPAPMFSRVHWQDRSTKIGSFHGSTFGHFSYSVSAGSVPRHSEQVGLRPIRLLVELPPAQMGSNSLRHMHTSRPLKSSVRSVLQRTKLRCPLQCASQPVRPTGDSVPGSHTGSVGALGSQLHMSACWSPPAAGETTAATEREAIARQIPTASRSAARRAMLAEQVVSTHER